jgi:7,8-dihydropterin-6-yl-methyl-4-(beta-D-ribofuranosyl)aminobenzene 5'-phosphate synthase
VPGQRVDLLLGGHHLAGATVEERIEPTVRDITELVAPRIVAPGHGTGWRAVAALANAFGPQRVRSERGRTAVRTQHV